MRLSHPTAEAGGGSSESSACRPSVARLNGQKADFLSRLILAVDPSSSDLQVHQPEPLGPTIGAACA